MASHDYDRAKLSGSAPWARSIELACAQPGPDLRLCTIDLVPLWLLPGHPITHVQFLAALNALRLSQSDLARLLGVTTRAVNLWATGKRKKVPNPVVAYLRVLWQLPIEQLRIELALGDIPRGISR